MNPETAIHLEHIGKTFVLPTEKRETLREHIFHLYKKNPSRPFQALSNISCSIRKGEFVGIIGKNGSGKSTLLKILARIYEPDRGGKMQLSGRLSPFLELGVGFHPELTARENVYLNGILLGLSPAQVEQRFDRIIEFAGLHEFVEQKLKFFSSGMQVRLAFAIAIEVDAEIILMDEVLAVGDLAFQEKCLEVFRNYKKERKTIVLVTHSMQYIEDFCDRVLVLDQGRLVFDGASQKGTQLYHDLNQKPDQL